MANTMTTYVKVVNLNPETHKKFTELFSTPENSSFVDTLENLNKIFGEEFNEVYGVTREWMEENVGSKWISVEFDGSDYSSEVELVIESKWSVPTEYIQKLVEVLNETDKNVAAYGTYEDEGYSPIGAFVYGYDYDDIEDYDEEIDFDEMINDDEYRDNIYDELYSLRDSLYMGYLEVKKEREEEQ